MTVELPGITQTVHASSQDGASHALSLPNNAMVPIGPAKTQPTTAPWGAGPAQTNAGPTSTLQFNLDPVTSQVIVQIVDGDNTEIIRKFPAEDALAFAKTIDTTTGLLIKTQA